MCCIAEKENSTFLSFLLPEICCTAMTNYTNTSTYACRTQRHNEDERHSSLEKYTSHFIERVLFERELETEQNCNILTSTLLAITAFLSRYPGLLKRGPGFLYRILSPTRLILNSSIGGLNAPSAGNWFSLPHLVSNSSDPQLLNRGPEGSLCWVCAFSIASCLQLIEFP